MLQNWIVLILFASKALEQLLSKRRSLRAIVKFAAPRRWKRGVSPILAPSIVDLSQWGGGYTIVRGGGGYKAKDPKCVRVSFEQNVVPLEKIANCSRVQIYQIILLQCWVETGRRITTTSAVKWPGSGPVLRIRVLVGSSASRTLQRKPCWHHGKIICCNLPIYFQFEFYARLEPPLSNPADLYL